MNQKKSTRETCQKFILKVSHFDLNFQASWWNGSLKKAKFSILIFIYFKV
jgi:hypothetical protein